MTRLLKRMGIGLVSLGMAVLPEIALSADELNQANTAWILVASALVLFMTIPGLALFYSGLVRAKNVLSVLMQCFAITCAVSIVWLACGYSLAFGDTTGGWIGNLDKAFMMGITPDTLSGDIPEILFAMFQGTFAIITPALIVGAFAERMRFSAMLIFSLVWLLLAYVPVTHWIWGGGWMADLGVMDFAGGIVVHVNAGVAALVAAMVIGNRKGFPTTPMPPHSLVITVIGASMLWVGWFGFNAGSALAADGSAAMAMFVTHISAAAGSLAWMAREWISHGKPSVLGIVTGMVAGLGTITPAAGFVGPVAALAIGLIAGFVCYEATVLIKRKLKIDDSLDVFPVHGVGGIIGSLLTAVFAVPALGGMGLAEGVDMAGQLGVQAIGIVVTAVWTAVVTWVALKILDATIGIRVDVDQETEGLDLVLHEERGYIL